MNCPRCERELVEVSVNGVKIDACDGGCGGIWFDAFELEKMDEPDESAEWLLHNLRLDVGTVLDLEKRIDCPRCDSTKLMRQPHPQNRHVMLDKCPACGGVWLDFGELFEIRESNSQSGGGDERKVAASAILRSLRG